MGKFFWKEPDNKYFRLCESYRFNSHKSSHGQYENERTELCAYKNRQRARSGPQAMVCQPLQTPYQHLNHAIKLNTNGSFSLVGNFFKQPCDFSPASSNFSKLELRLSQVFIVDDQKLCVEWIKGCIKIQGYRSSVMLYLQMLQIFKLSEAHLPLCYAEVFCISIVC